VRIAYNYNLNLYPSLNAIVTRFEVAPASAHPEMLDFYQDLQPNDALRAGTARLCGRGFIGTFGVSAATSRRWQRAPYSNGGAVSARGFLGGFRLSAVVVQIIPQMCWARQRATSQPPFCVARRRA
jgi:hypothetical protein